jgi:hypothetical protein
VVNIGSMRVCRLALLSSALWSLSACPGRLEDPDRFRECTLDVERDILAPKCGTAGCHDATTHQNNIDFASPGVGMRILGATSTCRMKPLVVHIPERLTPAPPCGTPMPPEGSGVDPLTATEVACVKEYLSELADGGVRDGG